MILVLNCGSQSISWKVFKKDLSLSKEGEIRISNSDKSDKYEKNLKEIIKEVKQSLKI